MSDTAKNDTKGKTRPAWAKWLRWALFSFLGFILFLTLLWAGVQTRWAKDRLATWVTQATAETGAYRLSLHGLDGILPFFIRVDRVTVSDARGPWLEAHDTDVVLKPWPLFRGILDIERFHTEKVAISRRPAPPQEEIEPKDEPDQSGRVLSLPRILIRDIRIQRIELNQAVTGTPLTYRLETRAETLQQRIQVRGVLEDLRHTDDAFHLKAVYDLGAQYLSARLKYHESPRGLVAGLAGVKDARGFDLDVQAEGPLSGITGQLNADMGGYGRADLEYRLSLDPDTRMALTGRIEAEPGWVPENVSAALGGLTADITCSAALSAEQILQVHTFTLKSPAAAVSMKGTADLTQHTIHMQATADPVGAAPFLQGSGFEYEGLGPVHLTATGPLGQPKVNLRTIIDALRHKEMAFAKVTIDAEAEPEKDFTGLKQAHLSVTAQSVQVPEVPALNGPVQVDLTAKSPDFITWGIDRLHVSTKEANLGVENARINTNTGRFSTGLYTRIHSLKGLLSAQKPGINGEFHVQAQADGNYGTGEINAHVKAMGSHLSGLPSGMSEMVGPEFTLHTRLALTDGMLTLQQAHLKAQAGDLQAEGRINLKKGTLDTRYHLHLSPLPESEAIPGMRLAGSLRSEGRIQGEFTDFTANATLESEQLQVNDLEIQNLNASVSANHLPRSPVGTLHFTGTGLDHPMTFNTQFAWSGHTLTLSQARAGLPGVDLTAYLTLTPAQRRLSGTARGDVESLELLRAVTGIHVKGHGDFQLTAGEKSQNGLNLKARFADLHHGTNSASSLTLHALIHDLDTLDGEIRLNARDVVLRSARLQQLHLESKGTVQNARIRLKTEGDLSVSDRAPGVGVSVSLSTQMQVTDQTMWRFRVDELTTSYGQVHATLARPATISRDLDKWMLDSLELKSETGHLQATGEWDPQRVQFSARVQELPLSLLQPLIAPDLTGVAAVRLEVSGPWVDPGGNVGVHIKDHRIPLGEGTRPLILQAQLEARRTGDRFMWDAEITGLGRHPFMAKGRIPAQFSLKPLSFHLDPEKEISGTLKGRFDLAVLQRLPGMENQHLRGQLAVDMGVAGSVKEWSLNGGVTIQGGRYENVALGLILDQITGRLDAQGRTLRLTRLKATDRQEGAMALTGEIAVEPPFPMDARLTFTEATLLRKEILTTKASGTLGLKGNLDRMDLTGDIRLDRTELTIPRRLPPDVVEIPVQEINVPRGMTTETADPGKALQFLSLDLAVEIPARFFVRGHGLDAEFKGRLTARGPAPNPVVRGTLKVVRGTYQFLARTFHIAEGQIAFDGSTPPTPFLNVTAQVNAGEIDAQVRITGPTDDFDLSLMSQPPLPQDEIMAQILFGQSAAKLNPFQAYQLASAIGQLSGQAMPDVMGKTRELLRVDRLSFSGGDNGDGPDAGPSVEAGRYVSEKVYVGVEQDLTDAKQDIKVEVNITPNFSVESKAGSKSGAGLGFSWKYDY